MKRRVLRWPDIAEPHAGAPAPPLRVRLAWMAVIWAASVVALLFLALLLRWVLKA